MHDQIRDQPLLRVHWRMLVHRAARRLEKTQHLVDSLADLNIPLLPIRVGPQIPQHIVLDESDDESDMVILGIPRRLIGMVDEKLLRARADCALGRLGSLILIGFGHRPRLGDTVAPELGPRALDPAALYPFLELGAIFEWEEFKY